MKRITYTGKMNIGGSGIGSTAMHQIKPLYMNKMLGKIYASDLQPPPDASLLHLFFNKIPEVEHPIYFVGDVIFDTIVSLQMEKPSILQTWLNHGYAQMLKYPDAIKIVNLFSTHPDVQAELVGIDTQNPVTKLSLERQRAELEIADWILVPSEFAFDSLKERGLDKKAILMPFGVDLEKFIPGKKKDDVFRVIFVGSNWERKGGPLLLDAWEKLNLKNAELVICGVSEEIVGEVEENVKVGWVPDLVSTLQNSSVFCLPALEDGCPLATHEAMACGLPVIVSENTGTKQYITEGEDGFIIKPNNVDSICEVLEDLYTKDVSKLGKSARKTIEKWPWERYETMYINFMTKL
jgi:glycosyltransferase involved in cell wall biosynthesis